MNRFLRTVFSLFLVFILAVSATSCHTLISIENQSTQIEQEHTADPTEQGDGDNSNSQVEKLNQADQFAEDSLHSLSVGRAHTVLVTPNGDVLGWGDNEWGQLDGIDTWNDIHEIYATEDGTVALTINGSVLATGNGAPLLAVGEMKDVLSLAVSREGDYIAGLKKDGSIQVVADDRYYDEDGNPYVTTQDVKDWTNVQKLIPAWGRTLYGLTRDGKVYHAGYDNFNQSEAAQWSDITEIAAGYEHVLGLTNNGLVKSAGNNESGQCDVEDWTDVVQVCCFGNMSYGLRSDGTVYAAGDIEDIVRYDTQNWTDIVQILAGPDTLLGIDSSGQLLTAGNNEYGQLDVNGIEDVADIASLFHTVVITKDSMIFTAGHNDDGQCDINPLVLRDLMFEE